MELEATFSNSAVTAAEEMLRDEVALHGEADGTMADTAKELAVLDIKQRYELEKIEAQNAADLKKIEAEKAVKLEEAKLANKGKKTEVVVQVLKTTGYVLGVGAAFLGHLLVTGLELNEQTPTFSATKSAVDNVKNAFSNFWKPEK